MLKIFSCCAMVSIIAAQSQCLLVASCVAFADCDHAPSLQSVRPPCLSNFGISRTRLIPNARHSLQEPLHTFHLNDLRIWRLQLLFAKL